jgi:hypothetical protein
MFGLMDNVGYAIAKASMIGMAKSLTVGRKDANININCIAPNAMTRISGRTEEEQEKAVRAVESVPAMDAANVAPMVAYLAHESCQVSGEVYLAGGGRFARLFVGVTEGYLQPGLSGATIDDVAANWAAINDEAGYYVPSDLNDCVAHYMSHLRG